MSSLILAKPYAEENIQFRDPYSGVLSTELISTIHMDLTFALALAAGFTPEDARTMLIWDQLVDTEIIGPELAPWYSACFGSFPLPPDPAGICSGGVDTSVIAWPLYSFMKDQNSCVFSRFGPYSPFFHFPRQTDEINAIRDWAMGDSMDLVGYEAYAWGAPTVLTAPCTYTQPLIIDTGLAAGSLEAFSIYLHSLGDSWSHRDCIQDLDAMMPPAPWPTHSLIEVTADGSCQYNPMSPDNQDAHGREFGLVHPMDSSRTINGILAVYGEMMNRSDLMEGQFPPFDLSTVLIFLDGTPTLEDAIRDFIHNWNYDNPLNPGNPPAERRLFGDEIASAVLQQRRHELYSSWPDSWTILNLIPLTSNF